MRSNNIKPFFFFKVVFVNFYFIALKENILMKINLKESIVKDVKGHL